VSLDYQYDWADNIAQIDDRLDAAAGQAFAEKCRKGVGDKSVSFLT
jgi:hypothetical protein